MRGFVFLGLVAMPALAAPAGPIRLYPGYLTRVRCEGRLYLSGVGNDAVVRLEALPKELGCGVYLKPLVGSGRTNLSLETSTGTIDRILVIEARATPPAESELRHLLKGAAR
jgi:hypothetical protein